MDTTSVLYFVNKFHNVFDYNSNLIARQLSKIMKNCWLL